MEELLPYQGALKKPTEDSHVANKDLLYGTGKTAQCPGGSLGGRAVWERTDTGVCMAESFAVHLELSQYCESAMLQYKVKKVSFLQRPHMNLKAIQFLREKYKTT